MRHAAAVAGALLALAALACGDPETTDGRGYTKAPLEEPGLMVRGEQTTEMSELGDPIELVPYAATQPAPADSIAER